MKIRLPASGRVFFDPNPSHARNPFNLASPSSSYSTFFAEFSELGTYVVDFTADVEHTNGNTYSGTHRSIFHVGPISELEVRDGGQTSHELENGQTAYTVVAVNNGPDDPLGAKVEVALPQGASVIEAIHSDETTYSNGVWDIGGELRHKGYYRAIGEQVEGEELTLILDCPTDGCGEATARIYNDNDDHPYTVCIGSSGNDLDHDTRQDCEAESGASWHEGTVYDYNEDNNEATLTARPGTSEPLPDAPLMMGAPAAALVTWTPVDTVNAWPVSHYEVQRQSSPWETIGTAKGTVFADTDVTPGQIYTYRVRAVNSQDVPGPWSQPMQVTAQRPGGSLVPGVPRNLSVLAGDTELTASWEQPADTGGLRGYSVQYREGYSGDWTDVPRSGTGRTQAITGLTNGTAYQVRVAATYRNAQGEDAVGEYTGPESATPVLGAAVPGDPVDLAVTAGEEELSLSWAAPAALGTPALSGYLVQYRASGAWLDWTRTAQNDTDTTETITGLVNGRNYQVRVAAVNTAGLSGYATASGRPVADPRMPGSPTGLALTAGDARIAVAWTAPEDKGNPALNGYKVEYSDDGGTTWNAWGHRGTGTSATITGLTNGTAYRVRVAAVNTTGLSGYAEATTTPAGPPTAPQNLALAPGDEQLTATWDAPANDGGSAITEYTVQYRSGGSWRADNVSISGTTATITGLTNDREYQVRVSAVNEPSGSGPYATAAARPAENPAVPGDPTGLSLIAGDARLIASWTAPADLGSPALDGYSVEYIDDGGATWTSWDHRGTGTTATITGLTNGTEYRVRVASVNDTGTSGYTATVSQAPIAAPQVPGAPTGLTVTAGNGELTASWNEPADLGNPPTLDRYVVEYRSGGSWLTDNVSITGRTATITGLENGRTYQVRVAAVNAAGKGRYTSTVSQKPIADPEVPGIPDNLSVTAGDGRLSASWDEPSDLGNPDRLTGYSVQYREEGTSGDWTEVPRSGTGRTQTITGLTNDREYEVRVAAQNAAGTSGYTSPVSQTPIASPRVPGAPTDLTVNAGEGELTATWDEPADLGNPATLDRYVVEYRASGSWSTDNVSISGTTATITGLTNDTTYQVRVAAVNAAGSSRHATASGRPIADPRKPGEVAYLNWMEGNKRVSLEWGQPEDLGNPALTGYSVQYREDGGTWTDWPHRGTGTTATITGLTNGTSYQVRVAAVNPVGTGPYATTYQFTLPILTPEEPRNVEFEPGDGQIKVTWREPWYEGEPPLTGYRVQYRVYDGKEGDALSDTDWDSAIISVSRNATSYTITGLQNGTTYQVQVWAVNAEGDSPRAGAEGKLRATPTGPPDAPQDLGLDPGNGQLTATWGAPSNDGGVAIARYVVQYRQRGGTWQDWSHGGTGREATITGLTGGTDYQVRVAAVNARGEGPRLESGYVTVR